MTKERKERSKAKLESRESKRRGIVLFDIRQTFWSVGWINVGQVAIIEKMIGDGELDLVHPCLPDA